MAGLRRCIGSVKFGIAAHDAPIKDFPVQPSQRDGLGRMCKPHWNEYTSALHKAAVARKSDAGQAASEVTPPKRDPAPKKAKSEAAARRRRQVEEVADIAHEPPNE